MPSRPAPAPRPKESSMPDRFTVLIAETFESTYPVSLKFWMTLPEIVA